MSGRLLIPRIGRAPTPIEGTLQLVLERPEALDAMAMHTFASANRSLGVLAYQAWGVLPEAERGRWRHRVLAEIRAEVSAASVATTSRPPHASGPVRPRRSAHSRGTT